MSSASLHGSYLIDVDLSGADLTNAKMNGAYLIAADLSGADLSRADLSGADLSRATLLGTKLDNAILSKCRIFGIAAWKLSLDGATQSDFIISDWQEAEITIDNLEIAQFIYMLLNNAKIRAVIDTLATKAVLILGRFTEERKAVLDAIREELRRQNYIPILFDFEKPSSQSMTSTVRTLAQLARFVIADITYASSIPQELMSFVPFATKVPVMPIIFKERRPYAMFVDFSDYHWVLPTHEYESQAGLILELPEKIIGPAEKKANEPRPLEGSFGG